ncbi:MAG: hypothetical protein ACREM6_00665 [Vulcanimicrobiaceae bacterium]
MVVDREAFPVLRGECEQAADTKKRLPDFVFRRSFDSYFAIEHSYIRGKKFGAFLNALSELYNDHLVNYMTIQPDPVSYYYDNLHFFGLASFRLENLEAQYASVMPRDGYVDSFFARGGDVGIFWGSSLKWGIFCDRISWETSVVAISGSVDVPGISGFRCLDAAMLASYMDSQYHWNLPVAKDFTERFLANYQL